MKLPSTSATILPIALLRIYFRLPMI